MRALGLIMFAALSVIAAIHVYWGLGYYWPLESKQALVDAVIGDPRARRIPPIQGTGAVAAAIWAAGFAALRASGAMRFGWAWLARGACALLALVFLARAASGFALGGAILHYRVTPEFKILDLWIYSPLCLAFALGFARLAWRGEGY